jgi:hypothetical protein
MRRFLFFACTAFLSIGAFAQPRTFVASGGLDTNPCSRTQPCRSFGVAIAAVITDGEVVVLDSAGYGPATISKGVSIIAPAGAYAGITVTALDGFLLNAPGAIINLRGLSFTNLGGNNGINQQQPPAQLNIDSCVFSNFNAGGSSAINVGGPALSTTIRDSEFRNNNLALSGGGAASSIERCRFDHNALGVANTDAFVTIRDSVFFDGGTGVSIAAFSALPVVTVENCIFSKMTTAMSASTFGQSFAKVRLSFTTVVDSTTAMSGTQFVSFGNNRFDGNGADGTFSSTIPLK